MRLRSLLLAFALLVASIAVQDARATTISLTGFAGVSSDAFDGVGNQVFAFSELTSVPASETVTGVDGASRSETTYSFSNAGLSLTFDHTRATLLGSYAATFVRIHFSPSADVDYIFAGAYSSDAVDGGWTALDVRLSEFGVANTLYRSRQESFATPAESFVLGESGGDTDNILIGSPTGTLIAGRNYDLDIGIHIDATPTAATTIARATGYVTLILVPEPSSGLLLALGFAALAVRRSRLARN